MKKQLFLLFLFPLLVNAQKYTLSDYFYPMNKFQYTVKVEGKQSFFTRREYKISNSRIGQFLETNTEVYLNAYNHSSIAQAAFVLSKDNNRNAIISDKQVYYDKIKGPQNRTDHLTLFILPDTGKIEKWFETDRGSMLSCTAEYVDISFNGFSLGQKATAVKITKITKIDNTEIKEWSYWLPNYSKIATFSQWGKSKIKPVEVSDMIDSDATITELSKSLDLSYEEPKKKTTPTKKAPVRSKSTK